MRRRAFTLLELVAAIAVTALLASASAVVLSRALRGRVLADARSKAIWADSVARLTARRQERGGVMSFAIGSGELSQAWPAPIKARLIPLPGGVVVDRVRVGPTAVLSGRAEVPVSRGGFTESYALRLTGSDQKSAWVVFAGLSGQPLEAVDEFEVEEILRLSERDHAP
jgi:prepilin-type N-terminal cleavage/methylation domain-containing protein